MMSMMEAAMQATTESAVTPALLAISKYCNERQHRLYSLDRQFVKETRATIFEERQLPPEDDLRRLHDIHQRLKSQRNPLLYR
jgi:hypothetical protein